MEENERQEELEEVKEEVPQEEERPIEELEEVEENAPQYSFPWTFLIIGGVLLLIVIACLIVIFALK